MFAEGDKDHNGNLESGEIAPMVLSRADKNGDGRLSRTEWEEFLSRYPDHVRDPQGVSKWMAPYTSGMGIWEGIANSCMMILVTELGDKTFFIAAIMAMRHPRLVVFIGAFGAVFVMTILSVGIGYALPNLIPREYTHYAAAALFLFFGAKMLLEARTMGAGVSEELAEVEEEFGSEDEDEGDVEAGSARKSSAKSAAAKAKSSFWAIMWMVFTVNFLAEWGDRSQIATIAMAAAKDPIGVCLGGIVGHALCTGLAVVGGRLLASRISERTVTIAGGLLFLVFGVHSFLVGPEETI